MPADARVLIATRSAGKLREFHGLLADAGLTGITLDEAGIAYSPEEEEIECLDTFEENALAKARYFNGLSGMPVIADDSGLSVVALGGAPGIWSKRYSGRDDLSGQALDDANNARLQAELRGFRDTTASYMCAAAYVKGHEEVVAIGQTFGKIIAEARGDHGFGYDPYFYSTELSKTFGEAGIEEKAVVSHRGRAFRGLVAALRVRRGG
ncbi:MAG: non-canonical purine NTP pyrophosphatase [Gemmatimonadaceae bacterium]|nr:non-canonical purine NTP pyrophosphatase [Gemmatimonadaceae bacterium]